MLASLRTTLGRLAPRCARPLSTARYPVHPPPTSTIEEAHNIINVPLSSEPSLPTTMHSYVLPASLTAATSSAEASQTFMNIPPQEDPLLHLLASLLMRGGKRAKANRQVARTLLHIHAYTRAPPLPILRQAIFALSPATRVIGQKHANKMIYRPVALSEKKSTWQAIMWLLKAVENRDGGKTVEERLARHVIKIVQTGESSAMAKRKDAHEKAMMNRGSIAKT